MPLQDEQITKWTLRVEGKVQGVGFRPFVYRKASILGLSGEVRNLRGGVYIIIIGLEMHIKEFIDALSRESPPSAKVTAVRIEKKETVITSCQTGFRIGESWNHGQDDKKSLLPDQGMCTDCRKEIHDKNNRRYGYAFTTCVTCGPRYSIIKGLPFDRERTVMAEKNMCSSCFKEYTSPENSRFHAQTNSCSICGYQISVWNKKKKLIWEGVDDGWIKLLLEALSEGAIVGAKGIGGYTLLCDASRSDTIHTLRTRKCRPTKPLALMYPSIAKVEQDFQLQDCEREMLQSTISPIVLLTMNSKESISRQLSIAAIAGDLDRMGVMLPYTPLFELLLAAWGKPLVATSANLSGEPLIYDDTEFLKQMNGLVDVTVGHNRPIHMPQDDSVVQYTETGRQIILRNGRGIAPVCLDKSVPEQRVVVGSGALMKGTFSLAAEEQVLISQYLGNQQYYEYNCRYNMVLDWVLCLFNDVPKDFVVDMHPQNSLRQWIEERAERYGSTVTEVQHHHAHFYAILSEHQLLDVSEPVLGIIWDGSGYGTNGDVWGSECFEYMAGKIKRLLHLQPFTHLSGDRMAVEPVLAAFSLTQDMPEIRNLFRKMFSEKEWAIQEANCIKGHIRSSSMGRLVDAAAAILGFRHKQSYEGEAAMWLENLALRYYRASDKSLYPYSIDVKGKEIIWKATLRDIFIEFIQHKDREKAAYRFYCTLVHMIERIVECTGVQKLAFSGGVFQSVLLNQLLDRNLKGCRLFFHKQLSPNDENISYGQVQAYHVQNAGLLKYKRDRLCV